MCRRAYPLHRAPLLLAKRVGLLDAVAVVLVRLVVRGVVGRLSHGDDDWRERKQGMGEIGGEVSMWWIGLEDGERRSGALRREDWPSLLWCQARGGEQAGSVDVHG